MYAVIDLETTGFDPLRHDRIVEIAVVHVDEHGDLTSEWCTLVNPQRDLGPQHVHGVTAAAARRAPTFPRIAGRVAELLRDRVLVAHNLAFDAPFLAHQFRDIGVAAPIRLESGLCTMRMAARFLPDAARSLAACCAAAGIPLDHAHCALDDTRAAAMLLGHYIRAAGTPVPWTELLDRRSAAVWPPMPPASFHEVQRGAGDHEKPDFLARLVDHLPRDVDPSADGYLAILDRAIVDRRISATEADALVRAAADLGLDRAAVLESHRGYLGDLAAAALAEGPVGPRETAHLHRVADLLGLPRAAVAAAFDQVHSRVRGPRRHTPFRLGTGDLVVFTGQTREPRNVWEQRARDAGLLVAGRVDATTRLVVAADVDTMSIKAHAARAYGVPIVGEHTFGELIGRAEPV